MKKVEIEDLKNNNIVIYTHLDNKYFLAKVNKMLFLHDSCNDEYCIDVCLCSDLHEYNTRYMCLSNNYALNQLIISDLYLLNKKFADNPADLLTEHPELLI